MSEGLKAINLNVIPDINTTEFLEFINDWENKCKDLMFYSTKWPVIKSANELTIRKKVVDPGDNKEWYSREFYPSKVKYNELRRYLLVDHPKNMNNYIKSINSVGCVQSIAPGIADVWYTSYSKRWGGGKRDFCSLFIKREVTDAQKAQPRKLYTPASSFTNIQSLLESPSSRPHNTIGGISSSQNSPSSFSGDHIIRRFQVITIPINHPKCPKVPGNTRALLENYDEVRELANGDVVWLSVQSYSPRGWVFKSIANKAYLEELINIPNSLIKLIETNRAHR
ncbi:hypothetical protein BB558_003414 [Smittium angustum]|uniref:DUF3074 domain-containing protein n=1 Tax=Smittium angustum TaxID=133377 RepID=A0A2U1J685_SMIAN|nr:hypothetical protein BB558_003414 [Smittium angustum]